jgi:hypothetical protein
MISSRAIAASAMKAEKRASLSRRCWRRDDIIGDLNRAGSIRQRNGSTANKCYHEAAPRRISLIPDGRLAGAFGRAVTSQITQSVWSPPTARTTWSAFRPSILHPPAYIAPLHPAFWPNARRGPPLSIIIIRHARPGATIRRCHALHAMRTLLICSIREPFLKEKRSRPSRPGRPKSNDDGRNARS